MKCPLYLVAALLASLPMISGCKKADQAQAKTNDGPAAIVKVLEVTAEPKAQFEEVVGTVRPTLRSIIEAKTTGLIQAMPARLGQVVRKGDLLAQLDAREAQARVDQAAANREQAQTDLKRLTALLQQQALTQAEFDAAQARFRVADAALREAETMLGYTQVSAPFDGVVVRKIADVGDLAAPGKPLLELENPDRMRFVADVPEALFQRVSVGAEIQVHIPAFDQLLIGKVVELAPTGDPVSRTSRVELDLAGSNLRSGMFGRLLVPAGDRPMLLVPRSAVIKRAQLELLYVVRTNRAELRLVRTGKSLGEAFEILAGLSPGERVVIESAEMLRDGQLVSTTP